MPYIDAKDGTKLFVKSWGEGRPVILIHGWPLSGASFDDLAVTLVENGYKAIIYDRRGFGRSDQPAKGYEYDTLADDLAAVIEHTGATDATICGFSMGGGEVARYMSRHGGKNVRQSVLLGSVVPYMLKTDDNPNGVPQSTFDEMEQGMRKDRAGFFESFFKDFYGVGLMSSPVSDAVLHNSWAVAMQAGLLSTLQCAKAFATTDFRPDLPAFRAPTLIVHGTADATVPIDATSRPAHKAIVGSKLVELNNAPHGILETNKAEIRNEMLAFLKA